MLHQPLQLPLPLPLHLPLHLRLHLPLLLVLLLLSPPSLAGLSCIQCSSRYEPDCSDPQTSLRFSYPCLAGWESQGCLKTEEGGWVIRNCSKISTEPGCYYLPIGKVCSCTGSDCNAAPSLPPASLPLLLPALFLVLANI